MKFAHYRNTERVTFFNGAGYVVRHDMHPHTTFASGRQVTRQGHVMLTGVRQGLTDVAGFRIDTYRRPDSDPAYVYGGI